MYCIPLAPVKPHRRVPSTPDCGLVGVLEASVLYAVYPQVYVTYCTHALHHFKMPCPW